MPTLALPTRQHRDPSAEHAAPPKLSSQEGPPRSIRIMKKPSNLQYACLDKDTGTTLDSRTFTTTTLPRIHDHDPPARWRVRLCASISSRRSFSSRWATWRTALVLDVAALEAEHRCLMSNQMWQRSSTLRLHITGMWLCRRSSQMHAARSITYNSAASDSMCWSVSQALFVLAMCTGQISSI